MFVSVIKSLFYIPHFKSLKERRAMILSIKSKLIRNFGLSVAQVEQTDDPKIFTLGISLVSSDSKTAENIIEKVRNFLYIESGECMQSFDYKIDKW